MRGATTQLYADATEGGQERWALLLAGGDGSRLRSLTRELAGDDRPKQFCRVMGGETLLEQTWRRALLSVPRTNVMAVVTMRHERFYVMIGRVRAFLDLIRDCLPSLFDAFSALGPLTGAPEETEAVAALYRRLAPADFSREVLSARPGALGVIPVWGVTWSDLGSPERVWRVRKQIEPRILEAAYA